MTVYEIINLNREFLNRLVMIGFKPDDCKFLDMFSEYKQMRNNGEKVTYIVAILSDKYGISERKVYSVINHLSQELDCCKSRAVG